MEVCEKFKESVRRPCLPQEIDDIKSCESKDIVKRLNQYFTSISERLNSEHSQEDIPFDVTKLNEYIRTEIPENVSFRIPLMKHCELISIVNSLDVIKATGLDGITARQEYLKQQPLSFVQLYLNYKYQF